jgi:hypothetical protein
MRGKPISKHFFDEEGYDTVLYLVFPMINLYLFMRLGALATIFTEARFTLEGLTRAYFIENSYDKLRLDIPLSPTVLFTTDSFFEYLHRKEINLAVFWYSLFIAVIIATGPRNILIFTFIVFQGKYEWHNC